VYRFVFPFVFDSVVVVQAFLETVSEIDGGSVAWKKMMPKRAMSRG
jgi:hypothetical protein